MIAVLVSLVVVVALLWPARHPVRWVSRTRDEPADLSPVGLRAGLRRLSSTEVRIRRADRGWVAEFAELSAVGLDAGLSPGESARLACAVGAGTSTQMERLGGLLSETEAEGGLLGEALTQVASDDPDLAFLAAAWRLSEELGAAAAPAARLTAEVLRERGASGERRTVLAAGPRASMWLLTLLPLTGPLVATLLGLPVSAVYGTSAAMTAALVGLCLTASGWLWSRRLLGRALRPSVVT
jgi:tight adherence protein B